MPTRHVVAPGECLSAIALRYGFADVRVLYEHPDNADRRRRRPDPHVLHPGDVVVVPDHATKQVSLATGREHRAVVRRPRCVLRLVVRGPDGAALADRPYHLDLGSAGAVAGRTGADGKLEAPVSPGARDATLHIAGLEIQLRLGHLNPLHDSPTTESRASRPAWRRWDFRPGRSTESSARDAQRAATFPGGARLAGHRRTRRRHPGRLGGGIRLLSGRRTVLDADRDRRRAGLDYRK